MILAVIDELPEINMLDETFVEAKSKGNKSRRADGKIHYEN